MSDGQRYRIVLDTNVIVGAGSRWVMTDPPAPLPDHFESRIVHRVTTSHDGLLCEDILLEYAEKLEFCNHPPDRITRYLGHLVLTCEFVEIVQFYCEPRLADLDDTIFILCAINGKAHFLISEDHHLLDLRNAYDPPKIRTREEMRQPLALG
jgi:predicted nucleic acid-binding protein